MPVVFLCVGAAKAGTSWLYQQLAAHPECHLRSIKELHYFDALDGGRVDREIARHRERLDRQSARLAAGRGGPDEILRMADRSDWIEVLSRGREDVAAYLSYLSRGSGGARVVGEATPAYALLSVERLRMMAAMAPDMRFVYLMRDPVERLWSHVRMIAGRRDPEGRVTPRRCARILDRTLAGDETEIQRRGDYAGALARLSAAVPARALFLEAFEEMVSGDGLRRICGFLGIAPVRGDPAPVHEGDRLAMTPEQRRRAARWLAPQYAAAEAALGRRPAGWAAA